MSKKHEYLSESEAWFEILTLARLGLLGKLKVGDTPVALGICTMLRRLHGYEAFGRAADYPQSISDETYRVMCNRVDSALTSNVHYPYIAPVGNWEARVKWLERFYREARHAELDQK